MPPIFETSVKRQRYSWLFLPGYGREFAAANGKTRWRCMKCAGPPSRIQSYCNTSLGNMAAHMAREHGIPEGTVPGQPQYNWRPWSPPPQRMVRYSSEPGSPLLLSPNRYPNHLALPQQYSIEPGSPPPLSPNRCPSEPATTRQQRPASSKDEQSDTDVGSIDQFRSAESTPTPTAPRRRAASGVAPTEQAASERPVSSEPLEYASSETVLGGCQEDISVQICTAIENSTARIVKREIKKALKEVKRSVRREREKRRREMKKIKRKMKEVERQAGRGLKELRREVKREMKEIRKDMRRGLKAVRSPRPRSTIDELVGEANEVIENEGDEE